jgi:hypothetical protein
MSSQGFIMGQWKVVCSMCGMDRKSGDMVKNWQGQWRCPEHNEERHPQDFVREIARESVPDFIQKPEDINIDACDIVEISAIAGGAVAGCVITGYVHPNAYELIQDREELDSNPLTIVL